MKTPFRNLSLAIVAGLLLFSCSQRTVTRVDPDQQIDLSGRWNDVDSKKVANKTVQQFLNSPRYESYAAENGKTPAIIVGYINNKTSEHIDSDNFIKKFELEIFNSGLADLVESREFRERIREERADQQEFSSPETTAQWGKEYGADLMLFGTMTSETDTYNKEKVVNYIVTLYLTDLETNKRVWYGQEEIKKFIEN
ncbi:penicillin-binding protein activator LpoB [Fulvivirga sp. RKSG066]|uniref:penicillin-binding protein activator LpoB n=1 Tax=Fulvivirga aurantia TaxID=2529383 RepID=UPI0012BCA0FE|nr:penicillin-binding protein activator LpoB [Fulvivirga aurantia]MTI22539.1 penicillin-binding protein activator LpoB [Fulvivirga aurantia]